MSEKKYVIYCPNAKTYYKAYKNWVEDKNEAFLFDTEDSARKQWNAIKAGLLPSYIYSVDIVTEVRNPTKMLTEKETHIKNLEDILETNWWTKDKVNDLIQFIKENVND
jgi:hypothetical protein